MVNCSIKQCSARRAENMPNLTLHRFPKSEYLKKRWLDAIGTENINPRHKNLHVCSLHFEDKCFNRTLDVLRLREDAVPSLFLLKLHNTVHVTSSLSEDNNYVQEYAKFIQTKPAPVRVQRVEQQIRASEKILDTDCSTRSSQDDSNEQESPKYIPELNDTDCSTRQSEDDSNVQESAKTIQDEQIAYLMTAAGFDQGAEQQSSASANTMIEKLKQKCEEQRKMIKCLHERVRRRDIKIATLTKVIQVLRKKKYIDTKQALLLEECAGDQDFFKRLISKSKDESFEEEYSEEIRKFALTLHFYSPKAYNFIRSKYTTCLPHAKTLRQWYKNIDAEPGLTKEEFFAALKIKAAQSNTNNLYYRYHNKKYYILCL